MRPKSSSNDSMGVRLLRAMNESGYTQRNLARLADTSDHVIANIIAERCNPRSDTLVKLCRALNVSSDWFLGLSNEKELAK